MYRDGGCLIPRLSAPNTIGCVSEIRVCVVKKRGAGMRRVAAAGYRTKTESKSRTVFNGGTRTKEREGEKTDGSVRQARHAPHIGKLGELGER